MHGSEFPSALKPTLVANGIPYVLDWFRLTAVGTGGPADFDRAEATGSPMILTTLAAKPPLERLLPMDLSVVEFPGDITEPSRPPRQECERRNDIP
ncbi:hypothetical protein BH10PSE6_BH10PSE6_14290 [soil metagenome]